MRKKRKRLPVRMFRFLYKMGWKKAIYYPWEWLRIHQTFHWPKITQKWDRLTILLTVRCLAHIPVHRKHPRFQKGISPWKKVNAFFSRGASFLSSTSRLVIDTSRFYVPKAAQRARECAILTFRKEFACQNAATRGGIWQAKTLRRRNFRSRLHKKFCKEIGMKNLYIFNTNGFSWFGNAISMAISREEREWCLNKIYRNKAYSTDYYNFFLKNLCFSENSPIFASRNWNSAWARQII